jgi:RHS repeat-associated protein
MTSIPGSLNEGFTYDAEYRVNAASANGTIDYVYDGEGRRVQKQATTFVTTYADDTSGKVVTEYGVQNPTTGSPIAESGTEYVEGDHLGDSRMLINDAGQVVRRWDYLPFGEQIPTGLDGRSSDYGPAAFPSTPDDVLKKFTGKERDAETGLDYFGARYFSSPMGRFVSADTKASPHDITDPQGWNKYGYSRNGPLRYTDPDGKDWKDVVGGALNAFGSDNAFGAGRAPGGNSDFHTGQAVGDAVATAQGAAEAFAGAGAAIGGTLLDLTGVGALIGVPAQVLAVGAVVHGGTLAAVAGGHLASAAFATINNSNSQSGSYTNTHESGRTYSGKGDKPRSQASGKRVEKATGDKHVATDFTPAGSDREGFKDESQRLDANGGAQSDQNYNQRESPGKKYRKEDGAP